MGGGDSDAPLRLPIRASADTSDGSIDLDQLKPEVAVETLAAEIEEILAEDADVREVGGVSVWDRRGLARRAREGEDEAC
jgi:hypothetical protein